MTLKTRKAKGGKYIGRGSYGCTFRPAVKCTNNAVREKNAISKIMLQKEANEEYKIQPLLSKIDPEQMFTLYPYKMCMPNLRPVNLDKYNGECGNILSSNSKKALFLKDGGDDLTTVLNRIQSGSLNKIHRNFFRAMKSLFIGLELLHANDVVHLDIKTRNIVCKLISGQEAKFLGFYALGKAQYLMKYIDFGLTNVTEKAMKHPYQEFNYYVWPFETRLVNDSFMFGLGELNITEVDGYFKTVRRAGSSNGPVWLLDDAAKPVVLNLYEKIHTLIKGSSPNQKLEYRREILKKTDVYSLGLVLQKCYNELSGIVNRNVPKPADTITTPLYALVDKMTDPDYRSRLTAKDARIEYETLLQKIEQHFAKKKSA